MEHTRLLKGDAESTFKRLLATFGGDDMAVRVAENVRPMHLLDRLRSDNDSSGLADIPLRTCGEEFVLDRKIGEGGQGEVWEALQLSLQRMVALKRAHTTGEAVNDFLKEAFTTAQLDHPNIVPVYDIALMSGSGLPRPVLCMKRVQGRSWLEMLRSERERPDFRLDDYLARHLPILVQVANAVGYAHSKLIIHRDLKPAQVMVGDYGEVFLLDWGLAIYLGESPTEDMGVSMKPECFSTLETATNPAGSPAYMAPEQARKGTEALGVSTDIYLLGAILYELLAGAPPHRSDGIEDAMTRARANIIPALPADTPDELRELAMWCMATDPADRPRDVAEFRSIIEGYLTGAGRKQQSARIVAEIVAATDLDDYGTLSARSHQLAQAEHLWPDNPQIESCREQLLTAYVEVALAKGDFILAQLQAGRLNDSPRAEALRARVDEARDAAARRLTMPPLLTMPRATALLATYLLIVAAVFAVVRAAHATVLDEVHDKVASLARIAANGISEDRLDAVEANRDVFAPEFQRVFQQLNFFRRANDDIRYIYILRPDPAQGPAAWRVLVDADPLDVDYNANGIIEADEKGNPPGAFYGDGVPEMTRAFEENIVTSGLLADDWGTFISGFAPVVDRRTMRPMALLGVDIRFDVVQAKLRQVNIAGLVAGAVLLLFVTLAFLIYFHSRRALERIRLLEQLVQKQNAELRGKSI